MKLIKKLILAFSFMSLVTVAFHVTTYAAEEGEKIVTSEDISNTIIILNNLYKEGVLTEEEFLNAKFSILNPVSVSSKTKSEKTGKKLTAVERKRLKEAKDQAEKELRKAESKAQREAAAEEKERIKEAKKEACLESDDNIALSEETPRGCQLIKIGNILNLDKSDKKSTEKSVITAAERERLKAAEPKKKKSTLMGLIEKIK